MGGPAALNVAGGLRLERAAAAKGLVDLGAGLFKEVYKVREFISTSYQGGASFDSAGGPM
jgi:hypothetical protein